MGQHKEKFHLHSHRCEGGQNAAKPLNRLESSGDTGKEHPVRLSGDRKTGGFESAAPIMTPTRREMEYRLFDLPRKLK